MAPLIFEQNSLEEIEISIEGRFPLNESGSLCGNPVYFSEPHVHETNDTIVLFWSTKTSVVEVNGMIPPLCWVELVFNKANPLRSILRGDGVPVDRCKVQTSQEPFDDDDEKVSFYNIRFDCAKCLPFWCQVNFRVKVE